MKHSSLLLFLISVLCSLTSEAAQRPNIVLILCDDLGYGDVQALNPNSKIPTPHLNKLSEQGVTFTDAHTNSSVCTPTRYGLLTGRYCFRTRLKRGVLFPPNDKPLIADDRPTIASILKANGYHTGMVGKWHLGFEWARDDKGKVDFSKPHTNGPNEKGFDEFFGIAASLDMIPYAYLRNHDIIGPLTETQPAIKFPKFVRKGPKNPDFKIGDCLDVLAKEAASFIQKNSAPPSGQNPSSPITDNRQPYFLYIPLTGPHKPVWPHERFIGKTELGPYGDFVHQVDATVGMILDAVEKSGQADNTLVLFTSDNGSFMFRRGDDKKHHLADETDQGYRPADHTANGPWRGTKADIYEAGHRVPFFVRWPGKAKAGLKSDTTICITDVLATLCDITNAKFPEDSAQDSVSFLPDLTGKDRAKPRPPIIMQSVAGHYAIRHGDHKLILSTGSGGREKPSGKSFEKPYQLYNLTKDPGETNNLINQDPQTAKLLETLFLQIANGDQQ